MSSPPTTPDTTAPLRVQVTLLGRFVGDALRTHARPATFATVERLRALTRERRAAPSEAIDREIDAVLEGLSSEHAVDVIRAFGLYFQMVNLAEQLHRERRRRERALRGEPPLRGALETLPPEAALRVAEVELTLVFTAHPTEVLRRTTSDKLTAIAALLRDLDERVLTAEDRAGIEAELRAQILLLWQSNELYRSAPTVHDEARNLLARFRESLFDEAPLLFERFEGRFGVRAPTVLRFGSWSGGIVTATPTSRPMRRSRPTNRRGGSSSSAISARSKTFKSASRRMRCAAASPSSCSPPSRPTASRSPTCATRSVRVRRRSRTAASSRSSTAG